MIVGRALASLFFGSCMRCGDASRRSLCNQCEGAEATTFITPSGLKVVSLGLYDGPNAPLIHRLKYGDETLIATRLGTALARLLPPEWRTASLVPVPLHAERLAERGYNQASLLARAAGQITGQKTRVDLLLRKKETAAQATLCRSERAHNLAGAFWAEPGANTARVVLVDDVVTTGHTIDSCRAALESGGATVLGVLACAVARASTPSRRLETKTG